MPNSNDFSKATMVEMDDAALERIAGYFRALSEPMRLKILNALRTGECNVTELTQRLGTAQANTSKHLSTLLALGVVARTSRGTSAYYRIADPSIYGLCDLVCGQMARHFAIQAQLLGASAQATRSRRGP